MERPEITWLDSKRLSSLVVLFGVKSQAQVLIHDFFEGFTGALDLGLQFRGDIIV
jgi:hypothetical protein